MQFHELERCRRKLLNHTNYTIGQLNSAKKILIANGDILDAFHQHHAAQGQCTKLLFIYDDSFTREINLQIQNPLAGAQTGGAEVAQCLAAIGSALPQYNLRQKYEAVRLISKM